MVFAVEFVLPFQKGRALAGKTELVGMIGQTDIARFLQFLEAQQAVAMRTGWICTAMPEWSHVIISRFELP